MGTLLGLLCAVSTAWAGERELRVMSYNIHGMVFVKNDHSRYAKIGRILRERRARGDAPEIIAVQEAFHKRAPELWREAGYPHVLHGPKAKGFRIGSGLVVLSEHPLEATGSIVYDDCMDIDCLSRKGAQRVRVAVPGLPFPVEIANTHMQATYPDKKFPGPKFTRRARYRQTDDLAEFLGRSGVVAFFAGDFNQRVGDRDYARLVGETGAANGAELCVSRPESCDGADETGEGLSRYIDHVFVSSEGRGDGWEASPLRYRRTMTELVDGHELSDHAAVETTWLIRWP